MKDPNKVKQGKKNKAAGSRFELKVRHDLEEKGWFVFKNSNNVNIISVDPEDGIGAEMVPCKPKYNPFTKSMMMISGGFPDFIITLPYSTDITHNILHTVIGVEVKSNGRLDIEEKQKCEWLLDKKVFSKILIARKGEKRGSIVYEEFKGGENDK